MNSVSAALPYSWSKGFLKGDFLNTYLTMCLGVRKSNNTSAMRVIIYITTSFRVRKFDNTSAMRFIFFLKIFKIQFKFTILQNESENIFCFWDNCIWKYCCKLSLLTREYLISAVNGLTNSPKILHISQRDFHNLNCLHSDQRIS